MNTKKFLYLSLSILALSRTYAIDKLMAVACEDNGEVRSCNNTELGVVEIKRMCVEYSQLLLKPRLPSGPAAHSKKQALKYGKLLIDAGILTISSSDTEFLGPEAPDVFRDKATVQVQDLMDRVQKTKVRGE